jgi:hypothetical protein
MLPATNMTNHAVLERGLQTELTGHLGYAKGDPENRLLPNSRNGFTETTVSNEIGDVTCCCSRPAAHSVSSPPIHGDTRWRMCHQLDRAVQRLRRTLADIEEVHQEN